MVRWVAVALLLLGSAVSAPAVDFLPDEVGAAVMVGNNPGSVPAISTLSWEAWRTGEVRFFGTLLAPEREKLGVGIDGGAADGSIRGGLGYVDKSLWGVYLRYRF